MTEKAVRRPGGDFSRNLLTLVSGTTLAQAIPILLQPLLRRLFSVEDFAAMAVFLSIVGILVVISTLRYEMAIVLPKADRDGANLVTLSMLLSLVINGLALLTIILFRDGIMRLTGFPEAYGNWLFLVPLSAFLLSVYQALNYWLIRKSAYRASSINKLIRRAAEGSVQTATGAAGYSLGLVGGDIIGNFMNVISGLWQVRKHGFRYSFLRFGRMKGMFSRYREFPLYQALPALLNTASLMFPVLIISHLYDPFITAQFDLSRMVMALPLALISVSLSQVLLQKSAEKRLAGEPLLPLINRIFRYLVFFSLPAVAFIVVTGPRLFSFIFSSDYFMAGQYARVLIFAFSAQFLVSPLSILFTTLERMRVAAIWQASYFVAISSLFFLKGIDITTFLYIFTGLTILAYGIYFLMIRFIVRQHDARVARSDMDED